MLGARSSAEITASVVSMITCLRDQRSNVANEPRTAEHLLISVVFDVLAKHDPDTVDVG